MIAFIDGDEDKKQPGRYFPEAPRCLWGRADLPRPADRPIHLPRARRAATGSDTPVGAGAAGCGSEAEDRMRVRRELRGLRRAQGRGSSTLPSLSTPMLGGSSAGGPAGRRTPASCWMRSSRRCMIADRRIAAAWCTTAIAGRNTCLSSTPSN